MVDASAAIHAGGYMKMDISWEGRRDIYFCTRCYNVISCNASYYDTVTLPWPSKGITKNKL